MSTAQTYVDVIEAISQQASRACGLVHDQYVKKFSSLVDDHCSSLPREEDRILFISIATEQFDYWDFSQGEPEPSEGYCRHGYPDNCCPLGCDDI